MDEKFEHLINSFLMNQVGETSDFLEPKLAMSLKINLLKLYAQKQFKPSKIGNHSNQRLDDSIRNDKILWIERPMHEGAEKDLFNLIDRFVLHLNKTCYTGIKDYEFHFAHYAIGSYYKRHLDTFKDDSGRAYSIILYLNHDWQKGDGGELCIYHENYTQVIEPLAGKCIFFKSSESEHEVLINNQPRLSITGWLKVL